MCLQQQPLSPNEDKVALGALETALAAAEDESDVQAARTAKAEAAADLAEFDETIPLEDGETGEQEMSKAELEVHNLIQQVCNGSTSVIFEISTEICKKKQVSSSDTFLYLFLKDTLSLVASNPKTEEVPWFR
jgi:hypothetical protein